jgi:flagellin
MFSIQTNVASLYAQQNMNVNSAFQQTTINRLSSGYRINSAADDAAGLAVANGLRSERSELTQGIRNGNDAVSQLQIADGGMNNISQILDRMKTLATQGASATFTGDYGTLDSEFQSLMTEVTRQAKNIGLDSAGGFAKSLAIYVGGGLGSNNTQIGTTTETVDLSTAKVDATGLALSGALTDATASTTAIGVIQAAVKALGTAQGLVGSGINTLNFAINLAQSQVTNYAADESRIRDADIASEAANLSKSQTLTQASMAALAQANQSTQSVLKLLQ